MSNLKLSLTSRCRQPLSIVSVLALSNTTALIEYTEVFVWGEDRNGQLGIDSQTKALAQNGLRPSFIEVPRSCSFNIVIK